MFDSSMTHRGYAYLWEFLVRPDEQTEFERHYGPDGTWAALFRLSSGYIGTELLHDRSQPLRYVTIDRWESVAAYRAFRAQRSSEYEELDRLCAGLTTHEASLGEFALSDEGN
jgi:heme-degrading monooxygenase HmoA